MHVRAQTVLGIGTVQHVIVAMLRTTTVITVRSLAPSTITLFATGMDTAPMVSAIVFDPTQLLGSIFVVLRVNRSPFLIRIMLGVRAHFVDVFIAQAGISTELGAGWSAKE